MEAEEKKDALFEELVESIKKGRISYAVRTQLEENYNVIERRRIVSRLHEGCSPLFLACKFGDYKSCDYLLDVCHADIEQRGEYEVEEDRSRHYVSPLWCAAVTGNLAVVKTLVLHGADMNSRSDTGSTPVRSACFMTHIEVVKYLIDLGAIIRTANYNGGTCLINSVQSVPLCKLLLERGAEVNAQDIQMKTALLYAIQEYRLDTVELLLKNEANPYLKNRNGDDALQTACLRGSAQIFDYLIQNVKYDRERIIEAYELLGAVLLEENHNIHDSLIAWGTAMNMRFSAEHENLPKMINLVPNPVYVNSLEFRTEDELQQISTDPDSLHMQALLICERILGTSHKDMIFRLMYRGAAYADAQRYQRCVELWYYALTLRAQRDCIIHNETTFTAQAIANLFLEMLGIYAAGRIQENVRFTNIYQTIQFISGHITDAQLLLSFRPVCKKQQDNFDKLLLILNYLLYVFTNVESTGEEQLKMKRLVNKIVRADPRTSTGESLLHLAVSKKTSIFDDPSLSAFPNLKVAEILVECGAPVNSLDYQKNCPLHTLSELQNYSEDLLRMLITHGAHVDIRNHSGETALELFISNPECTVNMSQDVTLKCLAAQHIMLHGMRYHGEVPHTLESFIEWH